MSTPWLAAWFVSLAVALLVTPGVRRLALTFGAVDQPHSRKVHRSVTPRLGGLGVVAGVFSACAVALPLLASNGWPDAARGVTSALFLGVSGIAITALGIYDDFRGARARTKLAVQIAVALLLYAGGFRLDRVDLLLGSPLELGPLSLPLTVFWIVGMSNAVNLIDGLDGLATGIALAASAAVFSIASVNGDTLAMLVALALIGSLLGFLVYNAHPASVFMGDSGSLFLGATLAALSIRHVDGAAVPFGAIVIVFGIPIVDTAGAIARRVLRGTPAFSADRDHLHHRLLGAGLSQRLAVLVLWVAGALLAIAGVRVAGGVVSGPALLAGSTVAAVLAVAALAVPDGWSSILLVRRKRNRERLAAVRAAAQRLRDAPSIRTINELLTAVAPRLDAQAVQLRESTQLLPVNSVERADDCLARTSLCLNPARPDSETLEVVWAERRRPERDAEIALELLGSHVAATLRRIRERPTMSLEPGPWGKDDPTRGCTTHILGYETTTAGKDECVRSVVDWIEQGDRCRWLACINPSSYAVAKKDGDFADALRSADWLIPDSSGIVLASLLGRQRVRERVTGSDLFLGVNEALERKGGGTAFFLGSTFETLALVRARMQRDFPSVRMVGFHSPPKAGFSESRVDDVIARINELRPDVLWVAMRAPKQERWIHDNIERLGVKFAAAVGGALDSYGARHSPIGQRFGLGSLPRALRESRRAWRATIASAPVFLWDVLTAATTSDRAGGEPPQPLLLTPPPMERVEQRVSSGTGTATAVVGGARAQGSKEAHQ
jgi:UDP-GlcNAc:undecaprenyl-phosphate/decaprenyl-phosphate GlcNAc-1-phosphate transferase